MMLLLLCNEAGATPRHGRDAACALRGRDLDQDLNEEDVKEAFQVLDTDNSRWIPAQDCGPGTTAYGPLCLGGSGAVCPQLWPDWSHLF